MFSVPEDKCVNQKLLLMIPGTAAEKLGADDKAQCWTDGSNLCSAASSGPRDDADGLLLTTRRAKSGDGPARGISLGNMQMKHWENGGKQLQDWRV